MDALFSIEQKRAAFSLQVIESVAKWEGSEQKEFKSYIQALPAQIQMNGFGQAVAFVLSHKSGKGGKAYSEIYTQVGRWLETSGIYESSDLLKNITSGSMTRYQQATAESQALLVWMKKMARAYLDNKEGA